jgi:hypothetical protein
LIVRTRGEGTKVTSAAQTAILLHVPEAEPLVGAWRDKGDPAAALGVPAHVTLLTPFLPPERVDEGVLAELEWFFSGIDAFPARFAEVAWFEQSGVLYLDPAGPALDELIAALARRWPETPPYAGAVDSPHAHLTVLAGAGPGLREDATAALEDQLPLDVVVARAALWACDDDGRWAQRARFDFGAGEHG